MKRFRVLAVTISLLLLATMLVGCGGPKTVTFPDENLEAAIRDALGKPAGEEITATELADLTMLWALFSDITDLTGLEYCTNLTELNIYGNQISDISPLSSLTNLSQLRLGGNQIGDISSLASLTNMILLYLGENQISDISPLSSLTNLTLLDLDGNQISDISPLASLVNLNALSLNENQIRDISPLASLVNIITLRLSDNQISDISPLVENSGLGEGDEVYLEDNNLDLSEGSDDMVNIRTLENRGVVVHYLIPTPTTFSLEVIPGQMEDSVSGQRCVFLVTVEDNDAGKAVNISAEADSQWWRENTTVTVNPKAIVAGQVSEVTVIPNERISGPLWVVIRGERDGLEQTETITINVGEALPDLEGLAIYATELRDKFIPWLASNHPEFGITEETEWIPSVVRPHFMVVMYYLFFSEEWEMGLRWHVTIPPYDWTEIYLRHRITEVSPTYSFKISSLEAQAEPEAVEPEEMVWR